PQRVAADRRGLLSGSDSCGRRRTSRRPPHRERSYFLASSAFFSALASSLVAFFSALAAFLAAFFSAFISFFSAFSSAFISFFSAFSSAFAAGGVVDWARTGALVTKTKAPAARSASVRFIPFP